LCPGSAWISGVFVRCSATIEKLSGSEPARLSPKAAKLLTRRDQPLAFSLASLWEVAIKTSLDRPGFSVDPALLHKALLHEGFQEFPHPTAARGSGRQAAVDSQRPVRPLAGGASGRREDQPVDR
jgi:hypothetical protein